jgi:hypothetical protein
VKLEAIEAQADGWRSWRLPLLFWAILAVGLMLRVAAFNPYAAHHPDESIQYLEQAHRLVFGYGVVPWEFRYFIRSWLIPLALAGPMQLGEWLSPGGTLYLVLPRALVAAFNSVTIIAAWFIGARTSRQHAIVAMAVVALWVESVLFSVQTLSESMAVACFLPAVALLRPQARLRWIVLAGFLMALAGLLRFQFAPAIAVFALMVAGRDWRMWKGLLIGGIPVVIGGAAIDIAMGLTPYEWILNNYAMNISSGRMLKIGGVSHTTYLLDIMRYWGFAAPVILMLSLFAGKAYRPLLVAALVNILVHQLIGHKEWRYLWFSMQILLILAAIGSVNFAGMTLFGKRLARPTASAVTAGLALLWGAVSLTLASSDAFRFGWRKSEPSRLAALAGRDKRVCGIAGNRYQNVEYGHAFVHRPIPVYLLLPDELPSMAHPGAAAGAFNAIIANTAFGEPEGFPDKVDCGGSGIWRVCLYTRPGGCVPNAASAPLEHQAMLLKQDM